MRFLFLLLITALFGFATACHEEASAEASTSDTVEESRGVNGADSAASTIFDEGESVDLGANAAPTLPRQEPLSERARRNLQRKLQKIVGELPKSARATIAVRDPANHAVIFDWNIDQPLIPASNTKLYSGAAALATLGKDYTFETVFAAAASPKDGRLEGDLIVIGAGDPTVSGRFVDEKPMMAMAALAELLKKAGVSVVDGDLLGDGRLFSDEGKGERWPKDPSWRWWMAEPGALVFNDNYARIRCRVENGKPVVEAVPDVGFVTIENKLEVVAERSRHNIIITRPEKSNAFVVKGKIWQKTTSFEETANVRDGVDYFIAALYRALGEAGIEVKGKPGRIASGDRRETVVVATYRSRLADSLPKMLKVSQNLYAEMFQRRLGVDAGHAGTYSGGEKAILEFLARYDILDKTSVLRDGSGLSKANRVSARQTLALLDLMWRRLEWRDDFMEWLPTPGEGTLRRRMKPLAGRVRAKTGTLSRISALSGYAQTKDGRWLLFSSIFNNCSVGLARRLQDKICYAVTDIDDATGS